MELPPPAVEAAPPESLSHSARDQARDGSEDHLPEWLRFARRVMRDYEEVRAQCRRQLEMVAAQREFLRSLNTSYGLAPDKGAGRGAEAAGPHVAVLPENGLLASLPAEERARLEPHLESVSLEFEDVLVEFDRPIEHVYFIGTAVTSTVVRTPDGGAVGVGLMGSEGFAGLSLLYGVERSNGSVVVQTPGRFFLVRLMPYRTTDDRIEGVVVTFVDITERKRAEEELRSRNEELERFNRAAVGRELRMVELKREVNALLGRLGEPGRYNLEFEGGGKEE